MIDPSMVVESSWPYRAALTRRSESIPWLVVEACVAWSELEDFEEPLPGGGEAELIVFMHSQELSTLDIECSDDLIGENEFRAESSAPANDELGGVGDVVFDDDPMGDEAPEVIPVDPEAAVLPDMEEPQQLPPPAIEDKLMLDGVELTCRSPIAVLAGACDRLGLRHSPIDPNS